jgi:CIC family chloride channel protein
MAGLAAGVYLSALLAMVGYFLVRQICAGGGGSGIPEIEGALEELRPVRWWRVLPVKFIGGMGTLGAGWCSGAKGRRCSWAATSGHGGRYVSDAQRRSAPYAAGNRCGGGAFGGL